MGYWKNRVNKQAGSGSGAKRRLRVFGPQPQPGMKLKIQEELTAGINAAGGNYTVV